MTPRTITIYRIYQISSHRTLGFYTGDEEAVVKFCNLKYDIESDDLALERVPVRQVTKSEVVCFSEVLDQLKEHKQRINELEAQADTAGMKEDVVQLMENIC
jgi:predicted transcriptional regulator